MTPNINTDALSDKERYSEQEKPVFLWFDDGIHSERDVWFSVTMDHICAYITDRFIQIFFNKFWIY